MMLLKIQEWFYSSTNKFLLSICLSFGFSVVVVLLLSLWVVSNRKKYTKKYSKLKCAKTKQFSLVYVHKKKTENKVHENKNRNETLINTFKWSSLIKTFAFRSLAMLCCCLFSVKRIIFSYFKLSCGKTCDDALKCCLYRKCLTI